jgi:hypothetical protein
MIVGPKINANCKTRTKNMKLFDIDGIFIPEPQHSMTNKQTQYPKCTKIDIMLITFRRYAHQSGTVTGCLWTLFIWMSGVWQAWTLTGLLPALIAREGLIRTSEQGSNLNSCKIEAQLLLQLSDTMHTNIAVASRGTKTLGNKCSLCYSMI